jgi:hypothetical protein
MHPKNVHEQRAMRSRRDILLAATTLAASITLTTEAHANGRYPESNQLLFSVHDPELVLLRVTFGLLVSHDRGRTFGYICENAIGYSGVEDPMYAVTPSKAYVGSTYQGVTITRDQGCGWSFAGGALEKKVFIDLSANPNDTKNIVVFASAYDVNQKGADGGVLFESRVWETKDEAETFQELGQALDPTLLGYTVDVTKTDPARIYITAVRDPGASPKGVLLTSKDHGLTWDEMAIPLEGGERSLYVAAVDPTNAERVYVRTASGVEQPTRLLLREADGDGGPAQMRTLYTATGALPGFVLSADGAKVYIGGPQDGVKVASTSDFIFETRSTIPVQCLSLNEEGLWACSNEMYGFVAGLSKDDGVSFEPRLRFCDLTGPLACPAGSPTTTICSSLWPTQKALLGCGGLNDGGTDGADGGDAGVGAGGDSGSCGCHATPAGPWGAVVSAAAFAAGVLRRVWRRRRSALSRR